jgi:hypothetical protein
MRKRKIFVAEFNCGIEMSFEIFDDGSVTLGGEPDDGYVALSPALTMELNREDITELWVTLREVLKESKK